MTVMMMMMMIELYACVKSGRERHWWCRCGCGFTHACIVILVLLYHQWLFFMSLPQTRQSAKYLMMMIDANST